MKNEKSKGLGDTVEKITTATGVKSFTNFLARNGVFGKKKIVVVTKEKKL